MLRSDPDHDLGEAVMEFRLTYAGPLYGASKTKTRADHKHEIRCHFHPQLRRLWEVTPHLRNARAVDPGGGYIHPAALEMAAQLRVDWLASQFQRNGYRFVPLVTEELSLLCSVSILFLRPDAPGSLIQSGDIDNRLKTLFDALRIVGSAQELGKYQEPAEDQTPFFCLLEDDSLITRVSVETDTLLEPVSDPPDPDDARLIITVNLRPAVRNWANGLFG